MRLLIILHWSLQVIATAQWMAGAMHGLLRTRPPVTGQSVLRYRYSGTGLEEATMDHRDLRVPLPLGLDLRINDAAVGAEPCMTTSHSKMAGVCREKKPWIECGEGDQVSPQICGCNPPWKAMRSGFLFSSVKGGLQALKGRYHFLLMPVFIYFLRSSSNFALRDRNTNRDSRQSQCTWHLYSCL